MIYNVRIHIYGIPYLITLTIIKNKEVNGACSMLLGCSIVKLTMSR